MRRLPRALATTSACLLLAGCGGNPTPAPAPRATGTPSPSASASPTPPALPAAAKKTTLPSARAFVRYYVEVLNYATFTGDTRLAHQLDAGDCLSCKSMLKAIESIYRADGRVTGGAWRVRPTGQARFPDKRGWAIDTRVSYGPQKIVEKAETEPKSYTGGSRLVTFQVVRTAGTWRIEEWTRES